MGVQWTRVIEDDWSLRADLDERIPKRTDEKGVEQCVI